MNPRHFPFLRLLLPWSAGIALGSRMGWPLPGLDYGLLIAAAGLVLLAPRRYAYRFRWVFGALLLCFLFGAGYWRVVQYDERRQPAHFSRLGQPVRWLVGTVYDAPSKGAKWKLPMRVEAAGPSADSLIASAGNVLLLIDTDARAETLRYGDRLWVQAAVRPTDPPRNPEAFDYRQYLHFQNIHYQAFVKERSYGVIATGSGHLLWRVAFRWRARLLQVLHHYFPGVDEFAVASALLVGYKDDLSDDLRAAYAETGSMHALAISGTHVGLLYAGLLFLLRRIPWPGQSRRWGETLLILLAIWAFTLLTGATASVLRASVMFSVYLIGKTIRRQGSVWNVLAASAFGLLWYNPYLLFDAGFQLSYAAVAGMVFFYPQLKFWSPPLPKWVGEGWKILLIGVAAQLGTLPLSLYYFHQFPVYFWLAGWVVVLGGAVFLWGGAVLVLLDALAPAPAAWLGWALHGLVWGMNYLIQAIRHLPGSVVTGIWVNAWGTLWLYGLVGLGAGVLMFRQTRLLLATLLLLTGLCISRAGAHVAHIRQRELVLYHTNRHFLLDFFDGVSRITWSDSLDSRQERFAAQAHRWARGVCSGKSLAPGQAHYRGTHLLIEGPIVQFYEQKILLLDGPVQADRMLRRPAPATIVVLRNNPVLRLQDALRCFPGAQFVFDTSNSRRRADGWVAECRAAGRMCHNMQEAGAWIMQF